MLTSNSCVFFSRIFHPRLLGLGIEPVGQTVLGGAPPPLGGNKLYTKNDAYKNRKNSQVQNTADQQLFQF